MRWLQEYRDAARVKALAAQLRHVTTRPHTLMEVCGGQTHTIVKYGLDELLPPEVSLIHGPGCPVCVTPVSLIDQALSLAARPEVTLCTFGDMLRVPGTAQDLRTVKAQGGDVRIVYSPLDALRLAQELPTREVVFFSVGFETTAPASAMAAFAAQQKGIPNFSLLVSHVLVPPALRTILDHPENTVEGFLAAGHVCTVMGTDAYQPIAARYEVPIVVTGFEPTDLMQGILLCIQQREQGQAFVENQYSRAVQPQGNPAAQEMLARVFCTIDRPWRGLGVIPQSGYALREELAHLDATRRFALASSSPEPTTECQSGLVLQGRLKPPDCPAFGTKCTPSHPLGAPMVSSEGACAAYYLYKSHEGPQTP